MTRPPDPESTPPAGPEPPHHGLVEELKEELEEVVEHVPRPVRWTVARLAWVVVLSVAGLVLIAVVSGLLYLANRTEWVARELTLLLDQTLARNSDLTLEIRDIKGNPLNGLRIIEPRLKFRDGDQPPLLEAPLIKVSYSAFGLLRGRGSIEFELERPVIRLARGADGGLRLPKWRSSPEAKRKRAGGFDFHFVVRDGSVRVPKPLEGVDGLELKASLSTRGPTRAAIHGLSWKTGPFGTRLERLQADYTESDSVRFAIRGLRTRDLALEARAAWARGSDERVLHLGVSRVRWAWLAVVFRNRAFDVPGEGRFVAHARGSRTWRGDFVSRLEWKGLPLEGHGDFVTDGKKWTVEPLAARSAAGDLEGRFEYSSNGWEVSGEARGADPARWGAIGIRGWPAGTLQGWFRYAVDPGKNGRLAARLGDSRLAGWRADSATVAVTFPADAPDSFGVVALRRGGTMTLDGASTARGWRGRYTLADLALDEWPDGRASGLTGLLKRGDGTVEGRDGELRVTGALEGRSADWLGAHMARWRIEELEGRLLPTPDLGARARLADVTYLGVHFDSAGSGLRMGDRALDFGSLQARAGDTLVMASGRAAWTSEGWNLALDRAAARSSQFDWEAAPPVLLSGDPRGVTFDRLIASDGPARLAIAGRWAGPGGAYDWIAHAERLDLSRLGLPPNWRLAGSAGVELRVGGPSGDPRWTVEAAVSAPGTGGHRADSLSLALSGSAHRLEVGALRLELSGGALTARGRVEETVAPWPDTLTAGGVLEWLEDAARWEGSLRATSFPLERVQAMAAAADGWSGRLDATLELEGSPARPELRLSAEGRPLAWHDYRADLVTARAAYREGRLDVEEIRMARGSVVSTASGALPLELRLGARPRLPDAPMSGHVDLPGGDLAVLPLFVPQIGAASGGFDLSARLAGTVRHPELDGFLRMRNGVVRLATREEVLEEVYADFRLDESGITLDSLSARQGARGRIDGGGVVELAGLGIEGYRFDLNLRDFTAVESGLYAAEFDGDFEVTNGPEVHGAILPQVTGRAEVQRAVVLFDFTNQSETQQIAATTQPLFWTYRVQASATSNLHWQPPDGDIEFSADLTLEQTPDSLIIYGDMRSLRGTYYFLSNRFNVQRADLTFDNLSGVNPLIDAEATTRVVPTQAPVGGPSTGAEVPNQVTVRITGRAAEPVVEFSSQPDDWDEPRILRELTVGRFVDPRRQVSLRDPLDNYLTRAINNTLSAELQRTFKGYVNEWVLERERGGLLSGEGDVIVGVGIPVTRNLQLRYRQRVPGLERGYAPAASPATPFERDVEAEYRLNRFFFVTTELTQRRILSASASGSAGAPDFNVNLKARWEY